MHNIYVYGSIAFSFHTETKSHDLKTTEGRSPVSVSIEDKMLRI